MFLIKKLSWSIPRGTSGHDYYKSTLPTEIEGIYIIWRQHREFAEPPEVLYIGEGHITTGIRALRNSPAIDRFRTPEHVILMTWADCPRYHYTYRPARITDSHYYHVAPQLRSNFHPLVDHSEIESV